MSDDHTDTPPADGTTSPPEANGYPATTDTGVDLAKLRAHVAKLRHWCRNLLADPACASVIPDAVAVDLRSTPPAMSEDEVMDLFLRLTKGEPVSPTHPAFTAGPHEPARPEDALAALATERERFRQASFTLYDTAFPDDPPPTEEELLREMQEPSGQSLSEILDEFERELEQKTKG